MKKTSLENGAFVTSFISIVLAFLPFDTVLIIMGIVTGIAGIVISLILFLGKHKEGLNTLVLASLGTAMAVFWLILLIISNKKG